MIRSPERIEIAVGGISLALLLCANLVAFGSGNAALSPRTVLAGSGLTAFCVVAGSVAARESHRVGLLVLHFLAYVLLLYALGGVSLGAEMLLLTMLEISLALRIPVTPAVAAGAVVLASTTVVGVSLGSTVTDRVGVLAVGAVVLFLAEIAVYYREALVRASSTMEVQARSLENLAAANQSFVAHLESVEAESAERERLLITRELHDCIGYAMTNIAMMMNASRYLKEENTEKLVEYCQKTRELASSTLQETRQILYKLRAVSAQVVQSPPVFFGKLCRDFSEATGVRTECHAGNLPAAVSERVFAMLFRAVQVGFINALRHGNACHIVLGFWLTEAELRMRIWNDTPLRLSDPAAGGEGIGFRGIRERLEAVSGSMSYGRVSDGYRLEVTVPREELDLAAD